MLTILGGLIGFLTSFIPEIFKFLQDRRDKDHEWKILQLNAELAKMGNTAKLEAIGLNNLTEEYRILYGDMFRPNNKGNKYVNFLTGIIRPLITIVVFSLYVYLKIASFNKIGCMAVIWTEQDEILFGAVMGFWFGRHAFGTPGSNGHNGNGGNGSNGHNGHHNGNGKNGHGNNGKSNGKGTVKNKKSR